MRFAGPTREERAIADAQVRATGIGPAGADFGPKNWVGASKLESGVGICKPPTA